MEKVFGRQIMAFAGLVVIVAFSCVANASLVITFFLVRG